MIFGIQEDISDNIGKTFSFSKILALGLDKSINIFSITLPISSILLTFKAMHILFSEPRALIKTGKSVPVFSKRIALPP